MIFKRSSTISCFIFYFFATTFLFCESPCAAEENVTVEEVKTVQRFNGRTNRMYTRAAANFLQNMDQSVDPCIDFYNFTCGGYMDRTANLDTVNPGHERFETIISEIKDILESDRDMPASKVSAARNIYANCMAIDLDKSKKRRLIETIATNIGLLNVKNLTGSKQSYEWNENFDWIDGVHKLREMGMNFRFLLGLYVTPRSQTDKRNILEIREPFLSNDALRESVYYKKENLQIGKARTFVNALKGLFPLEKFINGFLPKDVTFSMDDEIRIDMAYIKLLVVKLQYNSINLISQQLFEKIEFEIERLFVPKLSIALSRTTFCIHTAIYYDYNFQVAVSERFLPEKKKNFATEIVSQVLETAQTLINISKSFDDESRPQFINKLTKLQLMTGYSNNTIESPELDWTDVDYMKYVQNIFNISKHQMDAKFRHINLVKDVREWDYDIIPSIENVAYAYWSNNLYIPGLELASVMHPLELPNYMHFGTVGLYAAHEIGHSIDLSVSDPSGRSNKFTRFKTKVCNRCLNDAFYNIREEVKIEESEDFADLAGYKIAYYSYLKSQESKEDYSLPGLYYNSKQMFWISLASAWCSKDAFEGSTDFLHSPNSVRVLLPLANLPEFARDFNCPVGTPMNPKSKCKFL